MGITSFRIAMALVAGFALVSVPGCSKKIGSIRRRYPIQKAGREKRE